MKKNGHVTGFYLETLLLIVVFLLIVLVLTQVFGLAQVQSAEAGRLTESFREMDENVVLMFVTNMARYAIHGYAVGALDFVLKPLTYEALFKKYIARILKAIFVFGLIFLLSVMAFTPGRRTLRYFLQGVYKIFTGDTWSHMWYLYCLIGLYLLLPAYKKIAALSEEKDIRYLLIVYAVFLSILPQVEKFGVRCGFYIHVSSIYPFWLFLGYYIHRWGLTRSRRFYSLLGAGATVLLALLTWVRTRWDIAAMDDLFGYSSILVIAQAAGVAGWFFQARAEGFPRLKGLLTNIDGHSFGIYLIHMMFVRLFYKHLNYDPFMFGPAWLLGVVLLVLVSFVLSYILDWLLKKLPLFRGIL